MFGVQGFGLTDSEHCSDHWILGSFANWAFGAELKREYGKDGNNGTNGRTLNHEFSVCSVISVFSVLSLLMHSKETFSKAGGADFAAPPYILPK
jgi:hypothetical protein